MPIVEAADPATDLSQGDILRITKVHAVAEDGNVRTIDCIACLVLSRDCVAEHKGQVVAAPIHRFAFKIPEYGKEQSRKEIFEDIKEMLAELRDGGASPDRVYLGSIEGLDKAFRQVAWLDHLSTIFVPKETTPRAEWLRTVRIGRLTDDFRRALAIRITWAFGRIGFDDFTWYPTEDLRLIVEQAEGALAELRAAVASEQLTLARAKADAAVNPKEITGREGTLNNRKKTRDDFEALVRQFRGALDTRTARE